MSAKTATPTTSTPAEESEEDKELQAELSLLIDQITSADVNQIPPALQSLKHLIQTSTTSMTSVPKPLKYLAPFYSTLKECHQKMPNGPCKCSLSDLISVLAIGIASGDDAQPKFDCLQYCLNGTMKCTGDWGHEYVRHLESEIVANWFSCENAEKTLMPLVKDVMTFNCTHHAEIQACDLLLEIDQIHLVRNYIAPSNFQRLCTYLGMCAKYGDQVERVKIIKLTSEELLRFGQYSQALINSILINDEVMINTIFHQCKDRTMLFQLAFICARQLYPLSLDFTKDEEVSSILGNQYLNQYFLNLARELDVLEPKLPEDVYKSWLEPTPPRFSILVGSEQVDSARQNLASSFVNGFVNAGFGTDKLITPVEAGNKWIYRNKDHGRMSATAALGLIHMWDVESGLTPIDRYLYSDDEHIKAGALLALGVVNCRVRNDCDPALALLGEYLQNEKQHLQYGAILGMGLAYIGTRRKDIIDLLVPVIEANKSPEILSITSLACGLIALGSSEPTVSKLIIDKLFEYNEKDELRLPCIRLAALGVCLFHFGAQNNDLVLTINTSIERFEAPFRATFETLLLMCVFAGTGDVLLIQKLLHQIGDKFDPPKSPPKSPPGKDDKPKGKSPKPPPRKRPPVWDQSIGQAMAVLAAAVIALGEDVGNEMLYRIYAHVSRYGEPLTRKAVPLAIALLSVSNPQLTVIDMLTKISHDSDDEVACNAIFGLGIIGAGTNNARLANTMRQLVTYHVRNPSQLYMVRLAQGLVHMGKGTLTLNPLHTDRQLLDPNAMAGLLVVMVSLVEPYSLVLGRSHFLLYTLVAAIQPRWLMTLDEKLEMLPITVRVGQAVDVVGKAGTPKTIAGIHTHNTPVLLSTGERAELANEEYEFYAPTLDGICVLKKK